MLSKILFLVLSFSFSVSFAQNNPCWPDIEKFCKAELDQKAEFVTCLQKNIGKASKACQVHDKKMREVTSAIPGSCHPDFQKHCIQAETKAAVISCLKEKKAMFSADCSKEVAALK